MNPTRIVSNSEKEKKSCKIKLCKKTVIQKYFSAKIAMSTETSALGELEPKHDPSTGFGGKSAL